LKIKFHFIQKLLHTTKDFSMFPISLSLLQLAIPATVGLAAAAYLRDVTQRLLVDLCGTEARARFWVRCAVIAMLAVPLMAVLLLAGTPHECGTAGMDTAMCVTRVLRQSLAWTAGGVLAAVGVIARAVGRSIPRPADASRPVGGES
jgi:hypothetical protein